MSFERFEISSAIPFVFHIEYICCILSKKSTLVPPILTLNWWVFFPFASYVYLNVAHLQNSFRRFFRSLSIENKISLFFKRKLKASFNTLLVSLELFFASFSIGNYHGAKFASTSIPWHRNITIDVACQRCQKSPSGKSNEL